MSEKETITRVRARKPRITKNENILEQIFDRIADGESLNKICEEPGMPTRKSFFAWVGEDESILRRYEFAMILRADTYADDTIKIADDGSNDTYIDERGEKRVDQDVVARSRLRVDARKWYASKLAPKKYGDRITNEHEGGDPLKPISHNIQVSFVAANTQK